MKVFHILALLVSSAFMLAAPDHARAGIRTVPISGDRIELGELSPTVPRELIFLDIAPSPSPGKQSTISRGAVKAALKRAGADTNLANAFPASQKVIRQHRTLKKIDLKGEIVTDLATKLPLGVSVSSIGGLKDVVLPLEAHRIDVRLNRLRRATHGSVAILTDERSWAMMPIVVMLKGTPRTPVPKREIARASLITSDDLKMVETQLDKLPARTAWHKSQLIGKKATQPLRAGKPVQTQAIKTPPMVTRGQTVTLVAVANGMRISQTVVSQEDGKEDEWIRVQPITGTRVLEARIISPGEVRIEIGFNR